MSLIGSLPFKSRKWTPGARISGIDAPHEELTVDPALVALGADPRYPNSDFIAIPRGRIIAVRPDTASYEGRAAITIADGVDPALKPANYGGGNHGVGFTEANIFRKWQEHDNWMPTIQRQGVIELPYVPAVNNAYGALAAGDKLMPYFGSVATTAPGAQDKGKLVKWVEKKIYNQHQTAAGTATLANAIYPAFPPQIIFASSTGTVSTSSITLAFNGSNWVATFASGTVTDVVYSMGANYSQVIGEVLHIEPLSTTHQFEGWLQWVTDDFKVWDYPPQTMRVPVTAVTNEALKYTTVGAFRSANFPIAPYLTATLTLAPTGSDSFTITDVNGVTSTVAAGATLALPLSDLPYQDYTMGVYHSINPTTGEVFIAPNVVFNGTYPSVGAAAYAFQLTYSYETAYRDGRLYAAGQFGLTDGLGGTGYPGTPANLDVVGGAGALRAIIY